MADKSAYSRYLVFFHAEIERLGPFGTLEEYIFSPQAVRRATARHGTIYLGGVAYIRIGSLGMIARPRRCSYEW